MKKPVIEFKDFSFRYKSQTEDTLKHINLTIYEGEKVLLLGPSGCGKSTLAHCINGLIPFSYDGECQGSCKIASLEVVQSSIFQLSSQVGTVLQDSDAQFVGLSVGEDIAYALENENMPREEMIPRVYQSAKMVDMHEFLNHVPYDLSGGQKQRVALAGIMHDDVKILLFDEPLAALDPMMGNDAIDLIDRIYREQKKTVVIIEHRLEDVLYRHVDRVILMQEGKIIADMTPDELLLSPLLKENGIREPLYITALKNAGCQLQPGHISHIQDIDLEPYRQQLIDDFHQSIPSKPQEPQDVIIEVKDLSFAYQSDHQILDNVSFEIRKGEKIAIVGKNGAGKSTIAKLLCGILRPTKGQILLKGQDYMQYSIKEIGGMIGYVMQNPNQMIVKDMIKDEVALGLTLHDYSKEDIEKNVEEALKMCNLYAMRNWPVSALSYGQKKRVTIASILAMKPDVMILDEPTAAIDPESECNLLNNLKHELYGKTLIFTSHRLSAVHLADKIVLLENGQVTEEGSHKELLELNKEYARLYRLQMNTYNFG